MSIEFVYVEDCMCNRGLEMPELSVCNGSASFTVLRPQFNENLIFSESNGIKIESSEFTNLCFETLRVAKKNEVDLLITPEYSIPTELIKSIAIGDEQSLKPSVKKLWCLSSQGMTLQEFDELIQTLKQNAVVLDEALHNVNRRNFVNALFYVFVDCSDNLCFVPQLKTQYMRNHNFDGEGSGLSLGNRIFKFGKDKANQLLSFICADVFQVHSNEFNYADMKTPLEHLIILHPQLNEKPRNDSFSDLRNITYKKSDAERTIYITSNWAAGTMINDGDAIKAPWSAVYFKNLDSRNDWFEKEREVRKHNNRLGLGFTYFCKNKLKIWFSDSREVMHQMEIMKPNPTVAAILCSRTQLKVKNSFTRNQSEWQKVNQIIVRDNLASVLDQDEKDVRYNYPLTAENDERDVFFGISLGGMEIKQLFANDDEIPLNVGTYIDDDCDCLRRTQLKNFKLLKSVLENKLLPIGFSELNNDHRFDLRDKLFNLISLNNTHDSAGAIAFVDGEVDAKRVSSELVKKLDEIKPQFTDDFENFKEEMERFQREKKVCVLYSEGIMDIGYYPRRNEDISHPDRIRNEESILR